MLAHAIHWLVINWKQMLWNRSGVDDIKRAEIRPLNYFLRNNTVRIILHTSGILTQTYKKKYQAQVKWLPIKELPPGMFYPLATDIYVHRCTRRVSVELKPTIYQLKLSEDSPYSWITIPLCIQLPTNVVARSEVYMILWAWSPHCIQPNFTRPYTSIQNLIVLWRYVRHKKAHVWHRNKI